MLNNIIDLEGLDALDLFAGTGNISFELISRGCATVTAVERDFGCVKFIQATAEKFREKNVRAQNSDVFRFLGSTARQFGFIFADPPFDLENAKLIPGIIFEKKILKQDGLLVIEHAEHIDFSTLPNFKQSRHYGKVNFSFFSEA